MRIAVIADTHGLLRPEVVACCRECDHILHAGDIGTLAVLEELQAIAPITAVAGNVDTGSWARDIPERAQVELDGTVFFLFHIRQSLTAHPPPAGVDCLVVGHSHQPFLNTAVSPQVLNPGSCGRRRFSLPIHWAVWDTGSGAIESCTLNEGVVRQRTWQHVGKGF